MSAKEFSKTMRIDLIPDAPSEPVAGTKTRVVINPPSSEAAAPSAGDDASPGSRYQELLQSVYDAALICDLDGRIVDVNPRAVQFFAHARATLCQLSLYDVISGADEGLIETLLENLENERFTLIQAYCVRSDGSYFPAEIAVNQLRLGETNLCFFVHDITLRRQAEEMLRTEHNAIQNAGNAIGVADLDARLEYVNPAFGAMWGADDPEEFLGVNLCDLFEDRDAACEMVAVVIGSGKPWLAEMRTCAADGVSRDVQVSAACNRNSDGEPVGMVLSFVDIGDRRRAEQAEREGERQRIMLESLGAACHHLGQPATILLGNLEILEKRSDLPPDEFAEVVKSSSDAAGRLAEILHRLNEVTEYRTLRYIKGDDDDPTVGESRILDI